MTSQASAIRTLLFSFKRAFFSSINATATNSGRAFVTVAGVCVLLLLGGLAPAHAQSLNVKFSAAQSVVPSSYLSYPYRVAVDASGDVYISDTQNNRVLKETLTNGVYTESVVVSTGLTTPYGIAVDGSGNVYITDNGHNRIVEETPSGNSYTQTVVPTTALSYPTGLAADASGDLYIADTGHGRILVERPSGGSYIETVLTYSSNFAQITGIAVDPSGNIYVSDIDNQAVYEETYSAGSYTPSTIPTSGLSYPYDIAVDLSGNLYIADFSNTRIVLETNNSGSYTQSVLPTAALGGPLGVAIGGGGNLYIADTFGQEIKELQWSAGNFGPVNVNSPAGPINMLFQFYGGSGGATLSLTGTQVLTEGATGLDFTDPGSGNCSTSSPYSAGDFCWVNVDFTPLYPGTRMGAAQLLGTSAAVLANGYVNGMGNGPQINYSYLPAFFQSYVHVVAGSPSYNLTEPFGAVEDSSGNVYVVDYTNDAVYKETLLAGAYTQSTVTTGLNHPEAVAVDGAGNVYICDSGNNQLLLETNSGGSWVQSAIATSLNFPTGLAVDVLGNVYFSSFGDGAIYEITQSGGVYSSPTTVATGLSQPRKIAVDGSGNVYIADTGNSRVVKETLSGGSYTQSVIGSGMLYPYAIAVAADGTILVADTGHDDVLAETWSNGSYTQSVMIPGPVAFDIQVDQMGNVIFPDVNSAVFLISYAQLPSMSFASTNVGSTSSDSPQTVTITNVGNQPLTATTPGLVVTGPNFVLVAGSGTPEDCGTGFSVAPLAPGASCNLNISFEPQAAGALTSTAVFTDNALNANPSTQTIPLQGTGLQQGQTITFGSLSNRALGSAPFTLSATASSGLPVSFASLTTSVCTVSGSTSTLVAVGTCTIQATQAGNAAYTAATPVNQSFQVTQQSQASQTITFGSLSNRALGSAPFTLSATASSGLAVSFASTTTAVCTASGSMVTLHAGGTCTIQATQAGNATYAAATAVNQSFQVAQESQTITFGALSSQALGTAPFTVSATASSGLAVSFVSTTTAICTASGSMVTLHALGTCTIQATQAGNASYAAATAINQSFEVDAAGFTLSPSPTTISIAPGQSGTFALKVTTQGSFTSPISFSCSGLPAQAECTFSPATVTPDAAPATTTLTITTATQTASLSPVPIGGRSNPLYAVWLVLPAMLLGTVGMVAPKRRKLLSCLLVFLAVSGCLLQMACGVSTGSKSVGGSGTPAGSYTIAVTAAAGSTQHTTMLTLTVQ